MLHSRSARPGTALLAVLALVANAQSIDYPASMEFQGEIPGAIYTVAFKQVLAAKGGNWVEKQGKCSMPPNLQIEGSVVLTLRMDGKESSATLKVVGQKSVAGVPFLQTDAGLSLPLGQHCLIDLRRNAPAKLTAGQAKKEATDALATPSASKLHRLAQLLTRE